MPTRDPAVLNATRALLYEVSVTPKPGLVDPADVGPHPDMDVFTFIDSATALEDYWTTCFALGQAFTGARYRTSFTSCARPESPPRPPCFTRPTALIPTRARSFPWASS
jgi:Triphosphoribosyl-dephospho-CoA synthetase